MARILIIEDNATNSQLMGYLLRAYGHTVNEACDGVSGLLRAADNPDLILCDIQLPELDGYQVARWLKSHPSLRLIPLVAVTALAMVGDRDRVLAAGFDGYIPKPIEPEQFVAQVEAFLSHQSGEPPAYVQTPKSGLAAPELAPRAGHSNPTGASILVVDNLEVNLSLARSVLEPFGYRVFTALGIEEGLTLARAQHVDLILSDVCIGAANGLDLLRCVQADPQLSHIPLIFITSTLLDDASRREAMAIGAVQCLIRPIEPQALLAQIRDCLQHGP